MTRKVTSSKTRVVKKYDDKEDKNITSVALNKSNLIIKVLFYIVIFLLCISIIFVLLSLYNYKHKRVEIPVIKIRSAKIKAIT